MNFTSWKFSNQLWFIWISGILLLFQFLLRYHLFSHRKLKEFKCIECIIRLTWLQPLVTGQSLGMRSSLRKTNLFNSPVAIQPQICSHIKHTFHNNINMNLSYNNTSHLHVKIIWNIVSTLLYMRIL